MKAEIGVASRTLPAAAAVANVLILLTSSVV